MILSQVWTAYCDGASRGNPGPASYGVVVCSPEGSVVAEIGHALGRTTNQVAEYEALVRALGELHALEARKVKVLTDSQFVVYQVNGVYRVRDPRMLELWRKVKQWETRFESVEVAHIPRSSHPFNKRADALANEALDRDPAGGARGGGRVGERGTSFQRSEDRRGERAAEESPSSEGQGAS